MAKDLKLEQYFKHLLIYVYRQKIATIVILLKLWPLLANFFRTMASRFSYVQVNQSTSVQGDHRSGSKLVLTADVIACQTKPNDGGVGTRMSTDAAEVITTPNPGNLHPILPVHTGSSHTSS
jgi:hypothetical protein